MVAVAGGPVCGYGSEEHARGHSPRACRRRAPAPRPAAQPRRSRPGPSPLLHPMGAMPARLTMALMHAVWSFGRLQGPQAGVAVGRRSDVGRIFENKDAEPVQNPDFEPCEMKRFHFGGSEILSKPSGFPRDKGAFLVADWGGTSSHFSQILPARTGRSTSSLTRRSTSLFDKLPPALHWHRRPFTLQTVSDLVHSCSAGGRVGSPHSSSSF